MRVDLLVCHRGAACNGSLALIKALRLAGSLHHNLKMDYFAPMWVTVFCNGGVSKGNAVAANITARVAIVKCAENRTNFGAIFPTSIDSLLLKAKVTVVISVEGAGMQSNACECL